MGELCELVGQQLIEQHQVALQLLGSRLAIVAGRIGQPRVSYAIDRRQVMLQGIVLGGTLGLCRPGRAKVSLAGGWKDPWYTVAAMPFLVRARRLP